MSFWRSRLLFLYCVSAFAWAGDSIRELDYAGEIQQILPIEQVVWLTALDHKFLGLFLDAEKTDNAYAVLILHDIGQHPDRKQVVHLLRTELPLHGFASLSVQMPLREIGAGAEEYYPLFDEANARIQAGLAYLRERGAKNIAIVGYGLGANMAAYSLTVSAKGVSALIAISLGLPDAAQPQTNVQEFLQRFALPFLDIYAEFDLPAVLYSARQRRVLARENPAYWQIRLDGLDHSYKEDTQLLVKRVLSWLKTNIN